ncbi:MAG: glycoside hydrolase family 57 protein [Candidatus Eremiobacteraeota bacterium]|nr:glycoside hydrolase family 57 protein [Candidatus Eremiobacteraeota bacterium]
MRRAGRWPCGEEWLFQALLASYIPLLDVLDRLHSRGVRQAITLGVTPVLIEMLRDEYLIQEFDRYVDARLALLESDLLRFRAQKNPALALAEMERETLVATRSHWESTYGKDLIGALRALAVRGDIEVLTSAATHAYLPLLQCDSSVRAQLITGTQATARAFGIQPVGIWLPECAYHPRLLPMLEELNLRYFFSDSRAVKRSSNQTTLQPLRVGESSVAVFARDERASGQVWDNDLGYPGDEWYREFHKQDVRSGNRYWRVTDKAADLGAKTLYMPQRANERVLAHARHFAEIIGERLQQSRDEGIVRPYVVLTFDAELFGHWWAEGHRWLEETLQLLASDVNVAFTSPSKYLQSHPPQRALELVESSWGTGGDHTVWNNDDVAWMWEHIHRCERAFERFLVSQQDVPAARVKQAARELFLLQSSDWPFLITKRQCAQYAGDRFRGHVARFDELIAGGTGLDAFEADTLFEDIEVRAFRDFAECVS